MPLTIAILSTAFLITAYFLIIYYNRNKSSQQYYNLLKSQFEQYKTEAQQKLDYYFSQTLHHDISQSLRAMDETTTTYINEDEANRELATCLTLLGQNAKYHYSLDNNRILDIVVDDKIIIEGKLDPTQADIDRLVGQIEDYLQYKVEIVIVVYGNISDDLVERINGIVRKCSPYVSLLRIKNPHRSRSNGN